MLNGTTTNGGIMAFISSYLRVSSENLPRWERELRQHCGSLLRTENTCLPTHRAKTVDIISPLNDPLPYTIR